MEDNQLELDDIIDDWKHFNLLIFYQKKVKSRNFIQNWLGSLMLLMTSYLVTVATGPCKLLFTYVTKAQKIVRRHILNTTKNHPLDVAKKKPYSPSNVVAPEKVQKPTAFLGI